jgi:hypothetical protein
MVTSGSVYPADHVPVVKGRFDGGILKRSPLAGERGGFIEATSERGGVTEGAGESAAGQRLFLERPPLVGLQTYLSGRLDRVSDGGNAVCD